MIKWMNIQVLPVHIAYCDSQKSFDKWRKLHGMEEREFTVAGCPATTHYFKHETGSMSCIICFDMEQMDAMKMDKVIGLIAHEAVHAMQFTVNCMRDDNPSDEFQAYITQGVTMFCFNHWKDNRNVLKKLKK